MANHELLLVLYLVHSTIFLALLIILVEFVHVPSFRCCIGSLGVRLIICMQAISIYFIVGHLHIMCTDIGVQESEYSIVGVHNMYK